VVSEQRVALPLVGARHPLRITRPKPRRRAAACKSSALAATLALVGWIDEQGDGGVAIARAATPAVSLRLVLSLLTPCARAKTKPPGPRRPHARTNPPQPPPAAARAPPNLPGRAGPGWGSAAVAADPWRGLRRPGGLRGREKDQPPLKIGL
jgi:hypothetical protein